MKKIFVIISAVLILGSCKKTKVEVAELNLDLALNPEIAAVLSQTDLTAMKQSYSMLSSENQELLWKAKLSFLINNDKSLSVEQKKIVGMLQKFLNENGIARLKENEQIADDFINKNGIEFQIHFKAEQLYFLLEHPFFSKKFSLQNANTYFSSMSSVNKIFAVAGECVCRYDIGCGFGNSCAIGGCGGGSDCGLFGSSTCKGLCKQENGGPVL